MTASMPTPHLHLHASWVGLVTAETLYCEASQLHGNCLPMSIAGCQTSHAAMTGRKARIGGCWMLTAVMLIVAGEPSSQVGAGAAALLLQWRRHP